MAGPKKKEDITKRWNTVVEEEEEEALAPATRTLAKGRGRRSWDSGKGDGT